MTKKILTLCIVHQPPRVLLGMKKKGFGAGWWNGFGGKLEEGESLEDAARREVKEEADIDVADLEKMGVMEFTFQHKPGECLEVHIFRSTKFSGVPVETDEMAPAWYPEDEIPFEAMWPSDKRWLPVFLAGKKFRGHTHFDEMNVILEEKLEEVDLL